MTKSADVFLLCDAGDPWRIIEEGWHKERNLVSESIFSLGNEYMGIRGYTEEKTGAESMRGSYFNGIYEEVDLEKSYKGIITKTHFMVNTVDWLHTEIHDGDETLDMASCEIQNFRRILDMKEGTLTRSFNWHTKKGLLIRIEFIRFLSMENAHEAFQKMRFYVSGGDVRLSVTIANSFNITHGCDKKKLLESAEAGLV
jgi:maltose phosphorylase